MKLYRIRKKIQVTVKQTQYKSSEIAIKKTAYRKTPKRGPWMNVAQKEIITEDNKIFIAMKPIPSVMNGAAEQIFSFFACFLFKFLVQHSQNSKKIT